MMSECPLRDTAQTRTPLVRIPSFLARTSLLAVDGCQVECDDGRLSGGRDSGAQTGGFPRPIAQSWCAHYIRRGPRITGPTAQFWQEHYRCRWEYSERRRMRGAGWPTSLCRVYADSERHTARVWISRVWSQKSCLMSYCTPPFRWWRLEPLYAQVV